MVGDEDSVDVYMSWFLGDYWRDTGDLTCLEHGAYLQLLGRLWNAKGYLPFDPPRLAAMIKLELGQWPAVWVVIERFFTVASGQLSQRRLLYELEQARTKRQKAQAAANARWSKATGKPAKRRRAAPRDASAQRASCSSSASSPSSSTAVRGSGPAPSRLPTDLDIAVVSFATAWKRRYCQDYVATDADRSQLGRLLRSLTPEQARALPACFDRYLADVSEFVADKKRHSLAWFIRDDGFNKYRTSVPVVSAKERKTAAALGRFLADRGGE